MAAKDQGQTASQVPISQHPVFPAIVALWFAALLGIGSLVLPVALFEALAEATGLAAAVPAAAPPLGVTARILIALVFAALGVVAGLYIARKVVAAQGATRPAARRRAQPASTRRDEAAKRPISAREELGVESFDEPIEAPRPAPAPTPAPGRRRALAVTDESGPSELLDRAVQKLEDEIDRAGGPENITEENMPEAHIRGDIDTPYKCIGGAIFTMQRAGFARVGFIPEPPAGTGVARL